MEHRLRLKQIFGITPNKVVTTDSNGNLVTVLDNPIPGLVNAVNVVDIDDPSLELNALVGDFDGQLIIIYEASANTDEYTLYAFDSANATAENVPYTVDASGSGQWTAVAGKYVTGQINIERQLSVAGQVTIKLNGVIEHTIFSSDPLGTVDGDSWITDDGVTRLFNFKSGGLIYSVEASA